MDIGEVRKLLAHIQTLARITRDSRNNSLLAQHCKTLSALLDKLDLTTHEPNESEEAARASSFGEVAIQQFWRVLVKHLYPEYKQEIMEMVPPAHIDEVVMRHNLLLKFVADSDKFLGNNVQLEARRISTALITAVGEVLDPPAPSRQPLRLAVNNASPEPTSSSSGHFMFKPVQSV